MTAERLAVRRAFLFLDILNKPFYTDIEDEINSQLSDGGENARRELSQLRPGETGVISHVSGKGAIRRRMIDMGIVPGMAIEVAKLAPLGDRMEIKLKGFHLSLRKNEAELIQVETVA